MKEYQKYGTCIGLKYNGIIIVPKHRYVDGLAHYSPGICTPCVELTRKLRVSKNLSANGLETELLKVWNVKVADCYFDNQVRHIEPAFWTDRQIKSFRRKCRKHNQLVNFGIDPEVEGFKHGKK